AYWWRMIFSENRYSFFGIMRLLVAHDLIRKPVPTFRDHARSAAAGELARLVLELPRRQLGQRVIDVAGIEQPLRRQLDVAHLVLHEPGLHVEHAGDVDRAVRAARRPGIVVQQLRAGLGAGADRQIDEGLPGRAAVIGLAVVADGAQIADVIVLHTLALILVESTFYHPY